MEIYFAVQSNFEYQEYASKETALVATDFLVIVDDSAESKRRLIFKNESGNSRVFISRNWTFEFKEFSRNTIGNFACVTMTDPAGRIKRTKYLINKDWKWTILHEALNAFLKYSAEQDLRTVELLEENQKLKKEITEMKKNSSSK